MRKLCSPRSTTAITGFFTSVTVSRLRRVLPHAAAVNADDAGMESGSLTRTAYVSIVDLSQQLLSLNDRDVKHLPHSLICRTGVRTIEQRDAALAAMVFLAQEALAGAVVLRPVVSECLVEQSELRAATHLAVAGDDDAVKEKRRSLTSKQMATASTTAKRAEAVPIRGCSI
jgi:hypothetical protein